VAVSSRLGHPTTRIRFGLAASEPVTIRIYSTRGDVVATLVQNESLPAGFHSVYWNGTDTAGRSVASGVYLYRLTAGKFVQTRRLVLVE